MYYLYVYIVYNIKQIINYIYIYNVLEATLEHIPKFTLLFTVAILLPLTSSSTIISCSLKKERSKEILLVPSCSVL
jgi:hypothetical protein